MDIGHFYSYGMANVVEFTWTVSFVRVLGSISAKSEKRYDFRKNSAAHTSENC